MELNVSELKKTYGGSDGAPSFLLEIPPLSFELGGTVFIMGPNGSGKSVTVRLLAGEIVPDRGCVRMSIGDRQWKAHKRPCGIVRQRADESLATDLSVRENLLLRASPRSLADYLFPAIRLGAQVEAAISRHAELRRKLDQACRDLSGGQRQALAFLAVTLRNYPVLFLDEFLAATDSSTSRLLRGLAKDYAKRVPACVFVVSHDVPLALADADRLLVLRDGHLARDMRPGDAEWNEPDIVNLLI